MRSLLRGPSRVASFVWHDEVGSTNALAAEAAAAGAPEIAVVGADAQTAGRGRQGRAWHAPAGTSLQVSFLLRPRVPDSSLPLLPLVAGVVAAEVASAHVPSEEVALKWPNDLLVAERKAGGILVERVEGGAVVGMGLNVDWRGVSRPAELAEATSLSEAAGARVDRWKVLAGLVGVLDRRYAEWENDPVRLLDAYRSRCATLGRQVRVSGPGDVSQRGTAVAIADDGGLELETPTGTVRLRAGDVSHLRPA